MTAVLKFKPPGRPTRNINHARILQDKDLLDLYRGIVMSLPDKACRIVQMVSCYRGEGATTISRELAILATQSLSTRTLLIDLDARVGIENPDAARSLLDVALGDALIDEALAESVEEKVWQAGLIIGEDATCLLPHLEKIKRILTPLREQFQLILINTPGVLIDPAVVALGNLVDAAVLVVEAERTRAPAAKQAVQTLKAAGTKIAGMAFNKRQYHIPDRLYRLL